MRTRGFCMQKKAIGSRKMSTEKNRWNHSHIVNSRQQNKPDYIYIYIYPLVNQHSYWKWPFIVSFPIKKLPEGIYIYIYIITHFWVPKRPDIKDLPNMIPSSTRYRGVSSNMASWKIHENPKLWTMEVYSWANLNYYPHPHILTIY